MAKDDTITLPRSVVEHVMYHLNRGDADAVCWADGVIKPALEQSQGEQEPVAWADPKALMWGTRQSEKVVKLTCKAQPEYNFTVPLYTRPQPPTTEQSSAVLQPQVEQEPVAGVVIRDGLPCLLQDRHIKSTDHRVYTHPQPKREPLTEQQINDHRLAFAYASDDLPDPWDFRQGVKAAERAHGIGGEE